MGEQPRYFVRHGKRPKGKTYSAEQVEKLEKRSAAWVERRLNALANQVDQKKKRFIAVAQMELESEDIPSALDAYAVSIELLNAKQQWNRGEEALCRSVLGTFAHFGELFNLSRPKWVLGRAMRRLPELQREAEETRRELETLQALSAQTKNEWRTAIKKLNDWIARKPRLKQRIDRIMKALKEAQTELETIEPEVDRLLGELEEEWAKGMVSKDRYKIMRNNILRDLFRLRAKCARIEQQKHLFWVNEASLLIATSSVPESFTQELLRRLEKTTLDLNQARKGIL
jgi:hypothetical protein